MFRLFPSMVTATAGVLLMLPSLPYIQAGRAIRGRLGFVCRKGRDEQSTGLVDQRGGERDG